MKNSEIEPIARQYSNTVAQAGDLLRSIRANEEFIEKQNRQLDKFLNQAQGLFERLEKLKATQTVEEKVNGEQEANQISVSEQSNANASDSGNQSVAP